MIFWNKICGFFLILLFSCLSSGAQNIPSLKLRYNILDLNNKVKVNDPAIHFMPSNPLLTKLENVVPPVSPNFSTTTYGFFCRQELKIEKATKMPIRFRLGSLAQCNYYEGKRQ